MYFSRTSFPVPIGTLTIFRRLSRLEQTPIPHRYVYPVYTTLMGITYNPLSRL